MILCRITSTEFAGVLAASGKANRWNDDGALVIYTSGTISLACLENLVHIQTLDVKKKFSITFFEIPDSTKLKHIKIEDLPKDWIENENENSKCRKMGRKWYTDKETLVLTVPSSVIPWEQNFILNTRHPDFNKVKIIKTEPFVFDIRLL